MLVAHTADTLSFVSATLTDTCDVTSAADDAVLTCCLTIMDTAHFGVPLKLFPFYFKNKYHLRASTGHSRRFLRIFNRFRPCKGGQKRSQSLQDHFKFIIESLRKILNKTVIHEYLRIVKIIYIRKIIEFYSHKNCIKCSRLTSSSFVTL